MSQYYFTVASLPGLFFDSDNYPSTHEFLELCARTVSKADYTALAKASLTPPGSAEPGHKPSRLRSVAAWDKHEQALRNALVRRRAAERGLEAEEYLRGPYDYSSAVEQAVTTAAAAGDPLKVERALDQARWAFLDELEVGHYFDADKLAVYHLKLQILERKAVMNTDNGRARFDDIYKTVSETDLPD